MQRRARAESGHGVLTWSSQCCAGTGAGFGGGFGASAAGGVAAAAPLFGAPAGTGAGTGAATGFGGFGASSSGGGFGAPGGADTGARAGLGRERGGSASGRDGLQPCHAVRACAADRVQHACGVAAWSRVCGLLFGALMPCICRADLAVPLRDSACVSLLPNPFLSFLFVNLLPAGTAATGFGASAASKPAFGATAGAEARAQARNRTRTRARTRTDTIHEPRE